MSLSEIISLGAFLIAAGGWFISLRKSKPEIKVLESQEDVNLSTALNNATNLLIASRRAAEEDRDRLLKERESLEKRVEVLEDALDAAKQETRQRVEDTTAHRAEIDARIEQLNRDYAVETAKLRSEIEVLRGQITAEQSKNQSYKVIIERLVEALQKVDPKLLEGIDLTDTLKKIKAIK